MTERSIEVSLFSGTAGLKLDGSYRMLFSRKLFERFASSCASLYIASVGLQPLLMPPEAVYREARLLDITMCSYTRLAYSIPVSFFTAWLLQEERQFSLVDTISFRS